MTTPMSRPRRDWCRGRACCVRGPPSSALIVVEKTSTSPMLISTETAGESRKVPKPEYLMFMVRTPPATAPKPMIRQSRPIQGLAGRFMPRGVRMKRPNQWPASMNPMQAGASPIPSGV